MTGIALYHVMCAWCLALRITAHMESGETAPAWSSLLIQTRLCRNHHVSVIKLKLIQVHFQGSYARRYSLKETVADAGPVV